MEHSVSASGAPDWGFPVDRSLGDVASRREEVMVTLPVDASPSPLEVAFSVLFIFSRMLGQEVVRVRLLRGLEDAVHVVAEIGSQATLEEASASCRIAPISSAPEVGLVISAQEARGDAACPQLSMSNSSEGMRLSLAFDVSQIAVVSAQDFLQKIESVLDALSTMPQLRCVDLDLVTPAARGFFPDLSQAIDAPRPEFVPETFFRIARQYASETAITNGARSYTYGQLARVVCHLARQLTEAGLDPGDIVALSGSASPGMFAGMLAVMAARGVFVTLDSALPQERLRLIEEISQPRLRIEIRPAGEPIREGSIVATDWPAPEEIDSLPDLPVQMAPLAPDAAAYVFFTSGSTGTPKGVLGTHAGLGHFLAWQRSNFPIGPGDRVAQLTALSFDPVLREIFLPLTSGSCLQVPARDLLFDARRMLRWFSDSAITVAHCVPSLMKAWLRADFSEKPFRALRYVFFAGEPLTDGLLRRFSEAAGPNVTIVNLYGPTETTLAKLANRVERIEPGVQPVGYPQPAVDISILRNGVRCGLWEIGEIAIRTPYRSRGYLRNPALTAEVFRCNPERADRDDLIYHTGDLGRVRSDGKVEIFGRTDSQIKIRGVRIEPTEIESCMLDLPSVKDAAVTVLVTANEDKVLLGLVVPQKPLSAAEEAAFLLGVRENLKTRLSDAMVPTRIVRCESLPYLPNGKTDRKKLVEIASISLKNAEYSVDSSLSNVEKKIIGAWRSSFVSPDITKKDSFSSLGGDSLSYVTAYLSLENILGFVPQGWTTLPICELSKITRERSKWLCTVESAMMLRAIAIICVVIGHYGMIHYSGGATSALFFISGFIFGGLQLSDVNHTHRFSSIKRMYKNILIPYYVFLAALLGWYLIKGQQIRLSSVFMYADLLDYPDMSDAGPNLLNGHIIYLWYIHCIVHIVFMITGILWLCQKTKKNNWITYALLGCIGIGVCGRLIVPAFILPDFFSTALPDNPIYKLSPMSHIATFSFGALAGFRKGQWGKPIFFAITLYALAGIVPFGIVEALFIIVTAFFVLFSSKITVPRMFGSIMYKIAGASFFIYLLHMPVYNILYARFNIPTGLCFVLAIFVGYSGWIGWDWLSQKVSQSLRSDWPSPGNEVNAGVG